MALGDEPVINIHIKRMAMGHVRISCISQQLHNSFRLMRFRAMPAKASKVRTGESERDGIYVRAWNFIEKCRICLRVYILGRRRGLWMRRWRRYEMEFASILARSRILLFWHRIRYRFNAIHLFRSTRRFSYI